MKDIIPQFVFGIYHYLLAFLGAVFYGFPSRKLIVIGVTGTNGKSTVVQMASEILKEAGQKVASFSSIRFKIGETEKKNMLKMTMPGRFKLQKLLRKAVKEGCKYVLLEVTSEGIKQFRHKFIDFNGAVFTNLAKEHIEAHKGFENYKRAKGELFKALGKSRKRKKFAVINIDDPKTEYFLNLVRGLTIYTYGIKNKKADLSPAKIDLDLSLLGDFNIYNALAAAGIGLSQEITKSVIIKALKNVKTIPGRMELVINKDFKVFVDYAHTPESLKQVYQSFGGQKLICVLGSAGGGRDKWKRPEMGKIAAQYCSEIILTNEDPYNENPGYILSEIEHGISNSQFPIFKILDRKKAIAKAISLAKKDDVVIATGKGCEPWMCVAGGKKIEWDDRKVVREEYQKQLQESQDNDMI